MSRIAIDSFSYDFVAHFSFIFSNDDDGDDDVGVTSRIMCVLVPSVVIE